MQNMIFEVYLEEQVHNLVQREKLQSIFDWIDKKFPLLEKRIAWNQPMYTDHGTFIMGFSFARDHINIAPEKKTLDIFSSKINEAGHKTTKMLMQISNESDISYEIIGEMVAYNMLDKSDCETFWRK
jgi:uncharacterized protein YdhG (YjbR/CyaY superfamily)